MRRRLAAPAWAFRDLGTLPGPSQRLLPLAPPVRLDSWHCDAGPVRHAAERADHALRSAADPFERNGAMVMNGRSESAVDGGLQLLSPERPWLELHGWSHRNGGTFPGGSGG